MKLGQLIEYNMRNIFLEKSYTKCSGETIPRPFSKKSKLTISLDKQPKVFCNLFLLQAKVRKLVSASFSAWFLKKNIPIVMFYYLIFIVWLLLLREILGNMCIVIVYLRGCDVTNFEINLIFLIKLILRHNQKVKTKI